MQFVGASFPFPQSVGSVNDRIEELLNSLRRLRWKRSEKRLLLACCTHTCGENVRIRYLKVSKTITGFKNSIKNTKKQPTIYR